jgi:exonuclease III
MKIASYNVNSVRTCPLVLDWVSLHKPDVMYLHEITVQDLGHYPTRREPDVLYGEHSASRHKIRRPTKMRQSRR